MSFGFDLRNTSGTSMFLGDERCFVFHSKVDLPSSVMGITGSIGEYTLTYTGEEAPLVFIGPTSGNSCQYLMCTLRPEGGRWKVNYSGSSPRLYIFYPHPPTGIDSYGFNVYTESGALAFHSGYKPLRIEGIATLGSPSYTRDSGHTAIAGSPSLPAISSIRGSIAFVDYGYGLPSQVITTAISYASGQVYWQRQVGPPGPVNVQAHRYVDSYTAALIDGSNY